MIALTTSSPWGINYFDTTGPNTIPIDDIIYYGESLHRGVSSESILELYGIVKAFLIQDQYILKYYKSTSRKEGRESSKKGWYNIQKRIYSLVIVQNSLFIRRTNATG